MSREQAERQKAVFRDHASPFPASVEVCGIGNQGFGLRLNAEPSYILVLGTIEACEVFYLLFGKGFQR